MDDIAKQIQENESLKNAMGYPLIGLQRLAMMVMQSGLFRPRPIAEYHEDMGNVLWWKFPITEPPYVGSPLDLGQTVDVILRTHAMPQGSPPYRAMVGGWPGYHTHFTPIPIPMEPTDG